MRSIAAVIRRYCGALVFSAAEDFRGQMRSGCRQKRVKKMNAGKKWKIGWGFTSRCDMRCPFCYSQSVRRVPVENDFGHAKAFIDKNAAEIESVNYGTGECALSEEWYRLVRYIRNRYPDIRQALTSNGSVYRLVRKNRIDPGELFEAVREVDISLDFPHADVHNRNRGREDAFEGVLGTLDLCRQYRAVSTIVMVAYDKTLNRENIDGIFSIAGEYGAFVRINILRKAEGVMLEPPAYRQVMYALDYILDRYAVVSLCDPLFGAVFGMPAQSGDSCGATSLRILPDESVTPSTYLITPEWRAETLSGSLSLSDISALPAFRSITEAPVPPACRDCPAADTCRGGAADRRILTMHSLAEPDPYCPFANGDTLHADREIRMFSGAECPSVHDGYLPTLIFSPGER